MHWLIAIVITQQRHADLEGELLLIVISIGETAVCHQVIEVLSIIDAGRLAVVDGTTSATAPPLHADVLELRVHL